MWIWGRRCVVFEDVKISFGICHPIQLSSVLFWSPSPYIIVKEQFRQFHDIMQRCISQSRRQLARSLLHSEQRGSAAASSSLATPPDFEWALNGRSPAGPSASSASEKSDSGFPSARWPALRRSTFLSRDSSSSGLITQRRWNCSSSCKPKESGPSQRYEDPAQQDHYSLLGLPRRYLITPKQLDTAFRQQQFKFHPDKLLNLPTPQRELLEAKSRECNEAVRVLRSPLERAKYWLQLHDIQVLEEEERIEDKELLLEMMDKYEELDEMDAAESPAELVRMRAENEEAIGEAERAIDVLIAEQKYQEVVGWMEKLSLYLRLSEKIRAVEEGT